MCTLPLDPSLGPRAEPRPEHKPVAFAVKYTHFTGLRLGGEMGCTNNAFAFFSISTINVAITKNKVLFRVREWFSWEWGWAFSPLSIGTILLFYWHNGRKK